MDGASAAHSETAQQPDRLVAEQATLRRLAMLVAGDVPADELCRAVTAEVGRLFGADLAAMGRYVSDESVLTVSAWAAEGEHPDISGTWPVEGDSLTAAILRTGGPVRRDDWAGARGSIAAVVRKLGIRSSAATPIVIAGRTWGILIIHSTSSPLPAATESRIAEFAALAATAIAGSEARAAARRLADEQAALRRVATLVARDAPAADVFAAVAEEVGRLLGMSVATVYRYEGDFAVVLASWGDGDARIPTGTRMPLEGDNIAVRVRRGAASVRIDDAAQVTGPIGAQARRLGIRAGVGTPIIVGGRLWGGMVATTRRHEPLPADAEERIAQFAELVATMIGNAETRSTLGRVLAEQAALRRVATLVARETPPEEIFAAVAREVADVLGVDATHLGRFDPDGTVVSVAQSGDSGVPIGARYPLDGDSVSARVLRTGRPARMDGYAEAQGVIAATVHGVGIRFSIGAPISVEGRPWGVMIASSKGAKPFPPETESRLENFTELVATAISNASAHGKVRALAHEQAALSRVATVVARELPQAEVFGAIADEIGKLLAVDSIAMTRYDDDRSQVIVASAGSIADTDAIGMRVPIEGRNVASLVFETGRAARIDDYRQATGPIAELLKAEGARSVVGTPIVVSGRLWGVMMAVTHGAPLPPDTEARIGQFTELMATAIANADARAEVARLADEQAALRRVATLVAQGAEPSAVFDAVTLEVAALLGGSAVSLARYDADTILVLATSGTPYVRAGERYPLEGANVMSTVLRTGQPARFDDYTDASGRIAEVARGARVGSVVAVPVVVDGRTWGCLAAVWAAASEPPAHGIEDRMASFAELLDTAIANADSRDQLTASRARVLVAGDEARKRVVRDLHDGAQQRLLQTILALKDAYQAIDTDREQAKAAAGAALDVAHQAMDEVRELAHGILPSVLTYGGLCAGVEALTARLELPVTVDVTTERLAPELEASGYFIVAEALTNVVKHAEATRATVTATTAGGVLALEIRDDGIGGADREGHGLVGIADRVEALGGQLRIESPPRGGTVLSARLPLVSRR